MDSESGSAVLVDMATGEVLAMASSPSYNPNNFAGTAKDAMRNRSITDVFEPGSTRKTYGGDDGSTARHRQRNTVLNPILIELTVTKSKTWHAHRTDPDRGVLQKSITSVCSKLALAIPVLSVSIPTSRFGLRKRRPIWGWSEAQ